MDHGLIEAESRLIEAVDTNLENLSQPDIRMLPAYTFGEAAHYLRLPVQTVRNWVLGTEAVPSVIVMDDPSREFLSFMNLVEVHILSGISRQHGIRLPQVRYALEYVQQSLNVERPLLAQEFRTDGKSLFVDRFGQLINASKKGQITLEELLNSRLDRIDRDTTGLPLQLHPFTRPVTRETAANQPKIVTINPLVSFGRPAVRGVPTSELWSRYEAGDSIAHLAVDYGLKSEDVDEAIRCEAIRAAA